MKKCCLCKELKPLDLFNADKTRHDGVQRRCKTCQLAANRLWARRNPEVRRAALKRQYSNEVARIGHRSTKTSQREKKAAHGAISRAIKAGVLTRPTECNRCQSTKFPIHGHHDDYSKPLSVIWLCSPCHGDEHAALRRNA
jgi:hypothetical protein